MPRQATGKAAGALLPNLLPKAKSWEAVNQEVPATSAQLRTSAKLSHLRLSHGGGRSGLVFFAMRALFALLGAFANRHPIEKWAAFAALMSAQMDERCGRAKAECQLDC